MRKKLFSMLALLCLTAVGAWAQTEQTVDVTPVTGQTNQWTLTMPAGNVVLQVEYEPWKVTAQTNNDQWGTVEAVMDGEVKELLASDVTAWDGDNTTLSAADLPGFAEVTTEQAKAWDGYPTVGMVTLIYGFEEGQTKYIAYYHGSGSPIQTIQERNGIYKDLNKSTPDRYFYTTSSDVTANTDGTYDVVAGKSITLKATPAEGYLLAGWYKVDGSSTTEITEGVNADEGTLTLTPEADVTLRAEFREKTYTVTLTDKTYGDNAHVTATVGGTDATIPEDGTIQGLKAGQTVVIKAAEGYKFRKVEAKEGSAKVEITIGGVTLDITGCTTWEDIVNLNSDIIGAEGSGEVYHKTMNRYLQYGSKQWVKKTQNYNANDGYYWQEGEL